MSEHISVPEGYLKNPQGYLVPVDQVKPLDLLRDQTVQMIVEKAKAQSKLLAAFKAETFSDVDQFIDVSASTYDVKMGGKKGNVTLMSFDGRFKVQRQIAETLAFDERLQIAKELIDECITEWSVGSRSEIQVLINDAFQVDKEGRVSTSRIFGLRRLNISDEKWLRAMQAIADSTQVHASKSYIRVYERVGDTDAWQPIVLDIAAL